MDPSMWKVESDHGRHQTPTSSLYACTHTLVHIFTYRTQNTHFAQSKGKRFITACPLSILSLIQSELSKNTKTKLRGGWDQLLPSSFAMLKDYTGTRSAFYFTCIFGLWEQPRKLRKQTISMVFWLLPFSELKLDLLFGEFIIYTIWYCCDELEKM